MNMLICTAPVKALPLTELSTNKNHATVQLNIVDVDPETGRMTVGSKP